MYGGYPYGQNWASLLRLMEQSLHANEMVCSMSSQLYHIPATENLKGNSEMHDYLYKASYHRITAIGCTKRLQGGEYHDSIIQTLVACVNNGLKADKEIMRWLPVMKENAPADFQAFMEALIRWQQHAEDTLKTAQQQLRQSGYYLENQSTNASSY